MPLPEAKFCTMLSQIISALDFVHTRGVMHRDLKAGNVFLSKTGEVRVGDFGLARTVDYKVAHQGRQLRSKTTETVEEACVRMSCVGTDVYMAPEVAQGKPYNRTADVWSLGLLLLEMVTGKLIKERRKGQRWDSWISSYLKEVPDGYRCKQSLMKMLKSMLRTRPADRPSISQLMKLPLVTSHLQSEIASAAAGTQAKRIIRIRKRQPTSYSVPIRANHRARVASSPSLGKRKLEDKDSAPVVTARPKRARRAPRLCRPARVR